MRAPARGSTSWQLVESLKCNGLLGKPNLKVTADSETWLGFLAAERNLLWALLTRRVRLQGNPKWLLALKRCFPS